ncbi:MAG: hypothetical protein HZB26_25775 [Candidatus Hydrogenedentes bacterium]|nr:hypothetical protein [Candidatus Hydrogenedentota bacterium]
MYLRSFTRSWFVVILAALAPCAAAIAETLDLSKAVVVTSSENPVVKTAERMLVEEVAKRTGITLVHAVALPNDKTPAILLCCANEIPAPLRDFVSGMNVPTKEEGFAIAVTSTGAAPAVALVGADDDGVLFAAGRLLLQLRMQKGQIQLASDYRIATVPRHPHRGHQIAYRSLSHSYDAWSPQTYEQYMREMAVFGANAFELTSFRSPDGLDGPHAKFTGRQMSEAWSKICAEYGFEFWLFAGAPSERGESPDERQTSMKDRLTALRAFPHLDHVYLTGGDGDSDHRRPDLMIEMVGRFAAEARKIHPGLGVWVSNQGFSPEQNNWFFDYLQREQPTWLTGVVYGAWTRILPDEQRARVPKQYPIRRYDDIGHCVRAQYPVPAWDRALARTLGREPFAPRPRGEARIHNLYDKYSDGFVTYSDGIGDDVNKVVWSALGWDPDRKLDDIMLDYARFFFGWDIAEQVRDGIFRLEDAFDGSLAENTGVEKTFALWKYLEDHADKNLRSNWRFQSCVMRAYYDHYTRLRLLKANDIEERACAALREAPKAGVESAIAKARAILAEPDQDAATNALKARIRELGKELFESIGAQLDVANYKATNAQRGAVLEYLDTPLNNRLWLESEFDAILAGKISSSMPETAREGDLRLARLARVADWENSGPGSFYDDLGCSWKQPHLVKSKPLWDDPGGVTTSREDHTYDTGEPYRLSWFDVEEALFDTPLVMRYEGLDPSAAYRLRVTYLGRFNATTRLVADGKYEIHGAYGHTVAGVRYAVKNDSAAVVDRPNDEAAGGAPETVTPLEFVIPKEATQDGGLELTWHRLTGRGVQVAEVWLLKQ